MKCNFQSIKTSSEISKPCLNKHRCDTEYQKAIKVKAIYCIIPKYLDKQAE